MLKFETFKAMGVDLSTKATGLVVLQPNEKGKPQCLLELVISSKEPPGAARNREIVLRVVEEVHALKPNKIVIEGYSLNLKNASSIIPLVELGGLLRFMLHLDGLGWYAPTAPEVKKFVTGKGNSPKDIVMMNVLKRWGHEAKSNDTADAYVCAAMGLATANRLKDVTLDMRVLAGKLKLTTS